jgi:hypothetical protein
MQIIEKWRQGKGLSHRMTSRSFFPYMMLDSRISPNSSALSEKMPVAQRSNG